MLCGFEGSNTVLAARSNDTRVETCVVTCAGGEEKAWLLRLCLLFWNPVLPSAGFKQFLLSSECCNALSDFCNIRA